MSCFQRMSGDISIPKNQFAKLKRDLCKKYNEKLLNRFNILKDRISAVQGKKFSSADDLFDALNLGNNYYDIFWAMDVYNSKYGYAKLPKKSKLKMAKPNSDKIYLNDGDGCVYIDNTCSSVSVSVSENNRSVDDFENGFVWNFARPLLKSIKYTKHTGGKIYYSDEYMEDEYCGPSERYTFK